MQLHAGDAGEPDIAEARLLPDTEALADRPKPCLQEVRALPPDWTKLFDGGLSGVSTSLAPAAAALYADLGRRKAPLGLIAPAFDAPLPRPVGAVFPPAPREPPPPGLELFDLDDAFATTQVRAAARARAGTARDGLPGSRRGAQRAHVPVRVCRCTRAAPPPAPCHRPGSKATPPPPRAPRPCRASSQRFSTSAWAAAGRLIWRASSWRRAPWWAWIGSRSMVQRCGGVR